MPSHRSSVRPLAAISVACLGAWLAWTAPQAAAAGEFSKPQKAEIEAIIKDYLIRNPDVLRDALAEMERRQKADEVALREKAIADQNGMLLNSDFQAVLGNPKGKVTLVEFFDYNCGYCKRALDDMNALIKNDPDLRVVLKDFPVLGKGSVEAAQVASAVRQQISGEKFSEYHHRLLSIKGQVGKAQAISVAREMGLNVERIEKDMGDPSVKAGIEEIMRVADTLNLTGTPSYVVGNDVIVGAVGYDEIKGKLDNVRKCGKAVCS